jgi:hypothetical protein
MQDMPAPEQTARAGIDAHLAAARFRDQRDPDSRSLPVFSFHTPEHLLELVQQPYTLRECQIVAETEARTTSIDHLEAELDRQITCSNRLLQSTHKSAFAGTL